MSEPCTRGHETAHAALSDPAGEYTAEWRLICIAPGTAYISIMLKKNG